MRVNETLSRHERAPRGKRFRARRRARDNLATRNRWILTASPYVLEEVLRNLVDLPSGAGSEWIRLRHDLIVMDDILTLDRPAVFSASKDRPVLFSALAWADVLLTHDRTDFGDQIGADFYGLAVLTPGMFLRRERASGRLQA